MNKQEVLQHAKRLGIDVSNMTWNEMHSTVTKALKDTDKKISESQELQELRRELRKEKARNKELKVKYENQDPGRAPTEEELNKYDIEITPYIANNKKWKPNGQTEVTLNQNVNYDDNNYMFKGMPENTNSAERSFTHLNYLSDKVVGVRADPIRNVGTTLRRGEVFKSAYIGSLSRPKAEGYLWTDVKKHLSHINGGVYIEEYADDIFGNNNKKAALQQIGGRYVLPKPFVHNLLRKIAKQEKLRAMEEEQLGL